MCVCGGGGIKTKCVHLCEEGEARKEGTTGSKVTYRPTLITLTRITMTNFGYSRRAEPGNVGSSNYTLVLVIFATQVKKSKA